ncbi:HET domain-containing protein [Botrytis cinerea]
MRLLHYNSDGNFSLTEPFNKVIPEYAILSQRWETEKAKFGDLQKEIGTKKAGYKKLRFYKEEARGVGLKYFWVDTCCIDKSSSTELAEALNSMYRWCRDAARCYVCLLDVSALKQKAGDTSTEHNYTSKTQCYSRMLDCKMYKRSGIILRQITTLRCCVSAAREIRTREVCARKTQLPVIEALGSHAFSLND